MSLNIIIIAVLVFIILLLFVYFFISKKGEKSSSDVYNNSEHMSIVNAQVNAAVDLRSPVQVEFEKAIGNNDRGTGSFINSENGLLQISLREKLDIERWREQKIVVFFQNMDGNKISCFKFNAKCVDVVDGISQRYIYVHMPKFLDNGQKRQFLRIAPRQREVAFCSVWALVDLEYLPMTKEDLGKPLLYNNGKISTGINLDNISAGGLRANVSDLVSEEILEDINEASQLIFATVLRCEEDKPPIALWFICDKSSIIYNKDKEVWHLGVQFTHWATMQRNTNEIQWTFIAEGQGVPPLATWAMRIHMNRNKLLR